MSAQDIYMPNIFINWSITEAQISERIEALISSRSPRKVITRSGRNVRGFFPSLKSRSGKEKFESNLEASVLGVLEVSSAVLRLRTHPYVLLLSGGADTKDVFYTPDVEIETANGKVIIEIKGLPYLKSQKSKTRYRSISQSLRGQRIPFITILSSDIEEWPTQDEVQQLLKARPWPRFGTRKQLQSDIPGLDVDECSEEFLERWRKANEECDALLTRLMSRGPDETLAQVA